MKKSEVAETLKKFCDGSKTFVGFEFGGNYVMDDETFYQALAVFLKTGKNYLDDYSEWLYFLWDGSPAEQDKWDMAFYAENSLCFIENILAGKHPFIPSPENCAEIQEWVEIYRKRTVSWEKNKKIRERKKARKAEKEALLKITLQ